MHGKRSSCKQIVDFICLSRVFDRGVFERFNELTWDAAFLLTVGSFLLTVVLFYLRLTSLAFLLTVGACLLTLLAFLLTAAPFLLTVGKWESKEASCHLI